MATKNEQTHASPAAQAYAASVLDLANQQKQAEALGEELAALRQLVDENPGFREVLTNPVVSVVERQELLDKIFRGRISQLLFNALGVLNQKNRLGLVSQVAEAYHDLLDEQLGKVEVDLTVAQKLSPDQLEQARRRISQALGRDAVLHQYVDDAVLGGAVLRVGDKLIDASVRYQLQAMKEQLLAAAPK
jgi:F-type H+-transporting ATPase subunit delta